MTLETILDCSLKLASFCGVRFFLKIVSNLDLLDFSCLISGVMKGVGARKTESHFFWSVFIKKCGEGRRELVEVRSECCSRRCVKSRCKDVVGKVCNIDRVDWSC